MIATKNFNPESDVKLCCTCGHELCDQRQFKRMAELQLIRNDFGKAMIVTSGGRCEHHPNEARKSMPGDHQICEAVDIKCESYADETKLKVLAGRYGATRVAGGVHCGFVHIAWTETKRTDVPTWHYPRKEGFEPLYR